LRAPKEVAKLQDCMGIVTRTLSVQIVENRDLAQMLLCTFRYSLGRRTYITAMCRLWLEMYWPLMARWHRQIHKEIERAIELGTAGMQCDVEEWQKILALPIDGAKISSAS
jgi:hypothetical protein